MTKIILMILWAFVVNLSFAQVKINNDNPMLTSQDSMVNSFVEKYFQDSLAVGLSVGIIKDDKISKYNYGTVSKEHPALPTSKTIYEIGSLTKVFTSYLLAEAVVNHKLQLSDDIRKYLPGKHPNLQYENTPVQVQHLANHTARFPYFPHNLERQKAFNLANPMKNYTPTLLIQELDSIQMDTLPGYIREYSNVGPAIIGLILEKVNKISYDAQLKKEIFVPLDMQNSKLTLSMTQLKNRALGYGEDGKLTSYWDLNSLNPSGGIKSNVDDMLKFVQYQFDQNDPALKMQFKLTAGTEKEGTALGWGINTLDKSGELLYWHFGGTAGFSSAIIVIPALKSGYILLANNSAAPAKNKLVSNLVKLLR